MTRTGTYECERDEEIRSFDSFAECQRFVRREGDHNRLWSYVGIAQAVYELGFEPTPAQVADHFAAPTTCEQRPDWFAVACDIVRSEWE